MSGNASQEVEPIQHDAYMSEWFMRNYPNTTPGDMAKFYRAVYNEVPVVAPETNGYNLFHERMTGRAQAAFVAREQAAKSHKESPKRVNNQFIMRRVYASMTAVAVLMVSVLGLILVVES